MNDKAKALKNKITGTVGRAMATPVVKYHEAKMRQSDRDYKWLKGYNDKRKSGIPVEPKERAIMNAYKDKYK